MRRAGRAAQLFCFTALAGSAPRAFAQRPPTPHEPSSAAARPAAPEQPYVHRGFTYRSLTAVRYNPLGLSTFLRLGYQVPLLGPQENVLLQRTYAALHAITWLTPAYARGGVRFDIQPLAIFSLVASYELVGYFGSFDALQSFDSINEDFSDDGLKARTAQSYPTTGGCLTLEPNLQARIGPLTVVSTTDFVYNHMRLRGQDPLFFDLFYDMLLPNEGWLVSNETQLIYGPATGFAAGLRYGIYHAFLPDSAVTGNEARAREITPIQFLGPLFLYNFFEENSAKAFNAPLVFASIGWWLHHPYRTGQETPRAVPYVTLGFTFKGDL